ncbi:MAG TPA: GntR family transcriptional regulator [Rhizomicrobium sp.]|jgi:DNA-binding GntR family transcriptional regulator|nr:GntR family transcriptional regulator [Rhizomicrobium sp.]
MTHPISLVEDTPQSQRQIARPSGLVDEVYRRIRSDIMSLKIPPDTRISVDNMVRELGVSQTPIREALSMLEAIGLVTKKHFIGYCTAPRMDRRQLQELFEFRLLIEPYAARRAAEAMSEGMVRALEGVAGQMERHQSQGGPSHVEFAELDSELHQMIARGGGNNRIAESLEKLHVHLHIFRFCFRREIAEEAIAEHALVMNAIRIRDAAGAEAAMRGHIEKSYARLSSFAAE